MKRSEIAEKYKWRLEDIFGSDDGWEKEFALVKESCKSLGDFKGRLGNRDALLECLKLQGKIERAIDRLYSYSHMRKDENARLDLYVGMNDRMMSLFTAYSSETAYVESEISSLPDKYLRDIIEDKDFSDFDFMLKEIMRVKKHILSAKEEKLLAMAGTALGGCRNAYSMLNNADLPMPVVKIAGTKEKLTHGRYSFLMENGSQKDRKAAFDGMYSAYKSIINTTAALYGGSVKTDNFYASVKGFKSALDQALFFNDIPKAVYDNLIKTVKKNLKSVHEYVALRKRVLGLKTMHMYDMYTPLIPDAKLSMNYEEAYALVVEGLKPLGTEYGKLLKRAKDERWIDVMENEGKRNGAYCSGCYEVHPYVLLNYSATSHDIFTIAHEMGHAMHSYYSNVNQPYAKHGYQIFVAEVASTVNEVLLLKHMAASAKDKKTRAYLLNYYLDMFRTTLFRQTMFAEFEKCSHEMDQNGQPLTVGSLSDKYYELNKKYYGKAVRHDDYIRYEWARIPHFYTAFYVYKYSTGLTAAVNIAKKILSEPGFAEVYKTKFLSAGGGAPAYEILKGTGVDLAQSEPFEVVMAEFKNTLEELKRELE